MTVLYDVGDGIRSEKISCEFRKASKVEGDNRIRNDVIAEVLPDADTKEMMKIASQLTDEGFLTLLISERGKRASVVSSVPAHLKDEISASELVKRACEVLGGSGGGKPEIAQDGGAKIEKVEEAMEAGIKLIQDLRMRALQRKKSRGVFQTHSKYSYYSGMVI